MSQCYFCGSSLEAPVYRSTECNNCGKDCKICYNCDFYSETSHWECREAIREAVREKDKANYCDFFRLSSLNRQHKSEHDSADALKKLFGD